MIRFKRASRSARTGSSLIRADRHQHDRVVFDFDLQLVASFETELVDVGLTDQHDAGLMDGGFKASLFAPRAGLLEADALSVQQGLAEALQEEAFLAFLVGTRIARFASDFAFGLVGRSFDETEEFLSGEHWRRDVE
jgi:hypothetical protein